MKELFLAEYPKVEVNIKEFLGTVTGKFNVCIDGWMDSSSQHFFGKLMLNIGIVCSFLIKNRIENLAIGFVNTQRQKAIDLEEILVKCLKKYGIENRVNCIISDNGK